MHFWCPIDLTSTITKIWKVMVQLWPHQKMMSWCPGVHLHITAAGWEIKPMAVCKNKTFLCAMFRQMLEINQPSCDIFLILSFSPFSTFHIFITDFQRLTINHELISVWSVWTVEWQTKIMAFAWIYLIRKKTISNIPHAGCAAEAQKIVDTWMMNMSFIFKVKLSQVESNDDSRVIIPVLELLQNHSVLIS